MVSVIKYSSLLAILHRYPCPPCPTPTLVNTAPFRNPNGQALWNVRLSHLCQGASFSAHRGLPPCWHSFSPWFLRYHSLLVFLHCLCLPFLCLLPKWPLSFPEPDRKKSWLVYSKDQVTWATLLSQASAFQSSGRKHRKASYSREDFQAQKEKCVLKEMSKKDKAWGAGKAGHLWCEWSWLPWGLLGEHLTQDSCVGF